MLMIPSPRRWLDCLFTIRSVSLLIVGLLADGIFIQLDRMYLQGRLPIPFSLDNESGYAELYQNSKEFAIVVFALVCLLRSGEPLYGCWLGIFSYVFLDDTFQVHERLGAWVSQQLAITAPFGLRGVDVGELVVSATAGIVVCLSLILAWRRSGQDARRASMALIALLFALGFFGILMDMLHVVMRGAWEYRLGIIEDGGEMVVITAILWFFYSITRLIGTVPRTSRTSD